jgi:hypothetical protein
MMRRADRFDGSAQRWDVAGFDWDLDSAGKGFQRAIELNPGYATAHHWYAWHLALLHRYDDVIVEMKKAETVDPLSLVINADLAELLRLRIAKWLLAKLSVFVAFSARAISLNGATSGTQPSANDNRSHHSWVNVAVVRKGSGGLKCE